MIVYAKLKIYLLSEKAQLVQEKKIKYLTSILTVVVKYQPVFLI